MTRVVIVLRGAPRADRTGPKVARLLTRAGYDVAEVTATDPEPLPVPGHGLAEVYDVSDDIARWLCECGAEGRAVRSYDDEDLGRKAGRNHRQHAKQYRNKRGKRRP
jgi:hypothetical protein